MSIDDLRELIKSVLKKKCFIEEKWNIVYIKAPKGIYLGELRLIRFAYPDVEDIRINY